MSHEYFICHSSADKGLAEEAVSALEAAGHTTWFAPRDIPAGDPWPARINRAIRETRGVLLIGTATAFDSKHVDREIALADAHSKPVLPVIVDGAEVPPSVEYYLGSTKCCAPPAISLGRCCVATSAPLRNHLVTSSSIEKSYSSPMAIGSLIGDGVIVRRQQSCCSTAWASAPTTGTPKSKCRRCAVGHAPSSPPTCLNTRRGIWTPRRHSRT